MEGGREEASGSGAASVESRGVWIAAPPGSAERLLAGGDAPFREVLRGWLTDGPRAGRARLSVRSGDATTDATLDALAPAFFAMLERLTDRQREVARLLLLEGRRRAQVAEALGISRPTVSVMVDRARLEELPRVAAALDELFRNAPGREVTASNAPHPPASAVER